MIKALIFDLDGTIIDTPNLIMASFEYAIKENTNITLTKDEISYVLGQTLNNAFLRFADNEDHLKEMIKSFRQYSLNNGDKLSAYPDALEVIEYLKSKNYLVGLVTSKSRPIVNNNLTQLNMNDVFDFLVTFEDTKEHKPNPEPLLKALDLINLKPEDAIYIGDHENDILAGKNAKMKTGLMGYSHRLEFAKLENPDYIFESFKDIIKIIEK